jgi:uncharacterized membrane protein YsdA (DUF1294 family)/cold shock CspA family protein
MAGYGGSSLEEFMINRHQDRIEQGIVKKWQEGRGFGFIETDAGESVFFHASEFLASRRPTIGEPVVFTIGQDGQGRKHAKQVQELDFAQQKMARKNKQIRYRNQQKGVRAEFEAGQKRRLLLSAVFYAVLILLAAMNKLSWLVVGWYVVIGLMTYIIYAKDKAAAQSGEWRVPESTLHFLSVLGGWAGAMVAQTYLRHKSQKPEFRLTYYLTVLINLAGLLFIVVGRDLKGLL